MNPSFKGCYSPAFSASKAIIRSNNPKEKKERKNREKLMATTGSEFSLTNPEELELDYYDYNVINSAAAPGSYLGELGKVKLKNILIKFFAVYN